MKKIAKMSLVAAMAIAGMTTSASAVEGLSVSGKTYVEVIANTNKMADQSTQNEFDIDFDIKLSQKISDNLSATVVFQADSKQHTDANTSKQNANMANAYFTYTNGAFNANLGLQDINTPNTDGEEGSGSLVTYGVTKNITLAAAYYTSNGISDSDLDAAVATAVTKADVSAFAVLGSAGPVNFELWQVNLSGVAENTTAVLGGKFGPISVEARYAMSDYKLSAAPTKKDGESVKVTLGADLDVVSLRATYFETDKDGEAFVSDSASANTFEISQMGFQNQADVKAYHVGVTVPVGKVSYLVDYASAEVVDEDETELRFRAKAKVAKSTTIMATYSIYEQEDAAGVTQKENNSARFEVKYTF